MIIMIMIMIPVVMIIILVGFYIKLASNKLRSPEVA